MVVQLDASRGCGQKLPAELAHRELLSGKSRVLAGEPTEIPVGGYVAAVALILDLSNETTLSLGRSGGLYACTFGLRNSVQPLRASDRRTRSWGRSAARPRARTATLGEGVERAMGIEPTRAALTSL